MNVVKDSKHWQLVEDTLYGVTMIQHKTFAEIHTLWNTGYEAEDEKKLILKMTDQEFIDYCQRLTKNIEVPLPF